MIPAFVLAVSQPTLGGYDLHNILHPSGPQAMRIEHLWNLSLTICTIAFIVVLAATIYSIIRHHRPRLDDLPVINPNPATERRLGITVGTSLFITTILLFVLLIGDFTTGRAIHKFAEAPNPVTMHVIAHQWWWEITYSDVEPQNVFTTANEIHIPTGRPVKIDLDSADVIHSFWVPNLHGKKDAIPGHPVSTYLQADHPGTYIGECAEFCGFQHAKMHLIVVADPPDKFDQWLAAARQPSALPHTDSEKHGRALFLASTCNMCHTIGGTPAGGRLGPNLTHVGSRQSIAAGTLPNTKGHLGGWILDPQHLKPGVHMPQHNFSGPDLQALIDYLESLK
jgi:cytochrome c oxidase subunit 2